MALIRQCSLSRFPQGLRLAVAGGLLLVSGALSSADNLTPGFMLVQHRVEINRGRALNLMHALTGATWSDPSPFTEPDCVECWTLGGRTAEVQRVAFVARFDRIRAGELQVFEHGDWRRLAALSPMRERYDITLDAPVRTTAVRIYITDQANTDHAVLELLNWTITGRWTGPPVADPPALKLSSEAPDNVVDLPEPCEIRAEVASPTVRTVDIELAWGPASGMDVVQREQHTLTLPPGKPIVLVSRLGDVPQGPYTCTASVRDSFSGTLLSVANILVGLRDPRLFEEGRVEPFPGSDAVPSIDARLLTNGTIWSTEAYHAVSHFGRLPGARLFREIHRAGGDLLCVYATWHAFEPLPGVYNLEFFDRVVAAAREAHIGLSLGVWRWDFDTEPKQYWLADQQADIPEGRPGWDNQFSLWAPRYRRHARRAIDILVKRYHRCPEVWLWHPHPYGPVDHDMHTLCDRSLFAREAYTRFLRATYTSLERLNAAYGTDYDAFDAVPFPEPRWKALQAAGNYEAMSRVLDVRTAWIDYLNFVHGAVLELRQDLWHTVREVDPQRGLSGVNASDARYHAVEKWALHQTYNAFTGDQSLNLVAYIRRLAARQRFGLRLRHEDINAVIPGRRGFDRESVIDRIEWDVFQACLLGVDHYNFVFPAWDDNPAWDRGFANPRARALVREAWRAEPVTVPAGYLHSFRSDGLTGAYNFGPISLYRWWVMNGFSAAFIRTGSVPQVWAADGRLDGLERMRVVLDDGSRALRGSAVDRLVRYVEDGGMLILLGTSGETILGGNHDRFELWRRLGYPVPEPLPERREGPAALVFHQSGALDNLGEALREGAAARCAFGAKTVSVPLQFYMPLAVPEGGAVLGAIDGTAGAVTWSHGRGRVLLLAGEPGAVREADVLRLAASDDPAVRQQAAQRREDGAMELKHLATALWQDSLEWAGVRPPVTLCGGDLRVAVRQTEGNWLVYGFNAGSAPAYPRLRVAVPDPDARYVVRLETLDAGRSLGTVTGAALAGSGLPLPVLPPNRLAAVRISAEPH
ncbi:MAG: beta-galactosidase [Lentisphaerae bacterium]|nr:beta-galactosidase [Lentisphaerota bacterium]